MRGRRLLQGFRKTRPLSLLSGVLVGLGLYILLLAGYTLLEPYVASSAGEVYLLKMEAEPLYIALLLIFTSIGEEIFWRGFLLQELREALGTGYALPAASLIYSTVHVWTMNVPLMIIAFIAGMIWGLLYVRTGSLTSASVSHIVWTELVLIIAPLQ
jgi:membrane protease YdiL (CAAX protease family)